MANYILLKRSKPLKNFLYYSNYAANLKYKKYYEILNISENSDQEQIRSAYLKLVKKYHPDSGSEEANVDKFQQIDEAFRALINKTSKERWDVPESEGVQEQDIKHVAPQHRQYLSHEGVGFGTPFQREKQYAKARAIQAAENVYQHRISKASANDNALLHKVPLKHHIKTKYGYDRLVEDLIQESMSKGEFSNLSGVGKPLKSLENRNPYVDLVTHKLNEVLIENGFTPEWITLQKEIREEAQLLRKSLLIERQYFGPYPLSITENIEWSDIVYKYRTMVNLINKKILKFNLVVPILDKQMVQICLEKEAQKAMVEGNCYQDLRPDRNKNRIAITNKENTYNFLDFLLDVFKFK